MDAAPITLFEHKPLDYAELDRLVGGGGEAVVDAIAQLVETAQTPFIELGHRSLRATQYVGVLRAGGVTFQVLPKIDYGRQPDDPVTATRNLLTLLAYTQGLTIHEQEVAPLLTLRSDWFELLTRLLASNLHRLIQHGLEHAYVALEERLPVLRGRWLIGQQLVRHPYPAAVFEVAHDEFSPDTPLNRVFRFIVEQLLPRTRDPLNRRLLADLRGWLAEAAYVPDLPQRPAAVTFTRLNAHFRPAYNLAQLFLQNRAFQLTVGGHDTFAFMFDMNRLFEEFVGRFLQRHQAAILPAAWRGCQIHLQAEGQRRHLARRAGQPVFLLKPDILLSDRQAGPLAVLDTKYKRLSPADRQMGVAPDDVYQMLAYATRYDCPRLALLFPQDGALSFPPADAFDFQGRPARLIVGALNLHQPLDQPQALIAQMAALFRALTA